MKPRRSARPSRPTRRKVIEPMRYLAVALMALLPIAGVAGDAANRYAGLPGGTFRSTLKYEDAKAGVRIAPYALMREPVTNAQFLAFVKTHPQWRRDRVAPVLAESRYLKHWRSATELGPDALPRQPVTWVSWFAADAYCRSLDARLPTWSEWEYAAAADETRRDARADPVWRERILT